MYVCAYIYVCVFAFLVLRAGKAWDTHTIYHVTKIVPQLHMRQHTLIHGTHTCWSLQECTTGLFCTSSGCATTHTHTEHLQEFYWLHRKCVCFGLRKMFCTSILFSIFLYRSFLVISCNDYILNVLQCRSKLFLYWVYCLKQFSCCHVCSYRSPGVRWFVTHRDSMGACCYRVARKLQSYCSHWQILNAVIK